MLTISALKENGAPPLELDVVAVAKPHGAAHANVKLREDLPAPGHVVARPGVQVPGHVAAAVDGGGARLGSLLIEENALDRALCGRRERAHRG